MPEPDDEEMPPDPIAALSQALSGLKNIAQIVRTYYVELIAQGFTPEQALGLTLTYQTQLMGQ